MTTNEPLAIEATGLAKAFGTTRAVAGIDLAVPAGAIDSVLGPNGAGKTTTIRMLATLLALDEGSARVLGHDIVEEADAVRRRLEGLRRSGCRLLQGTEAEGAAATRESAPSRRSRLNWLACSRRPP